MYCRYLNDNKLEDFPIGSIVIFPESTIRRIGIVIKYAKSYNHSINIVYGEYYRAEKPTQLSGRTKWIARRPKDCLLAKEGDYDLTQVEYLLSVYNKEKKKDIKLIK